MNTLHIALLRLQIRALLLAQRGINTTLRALIAASDATLALAGRLYTIANGYLNHAHACAIVSLALAREHHADQRQRGTTNTADELLEIIALLGAPAVFAWAALDYIAGPASGQLIALLPH